MGNQGVADTVLGQGNQAEQSQPRHSSLRNVPIPSFIDKSRVILRTKANKLKAHSFVFQVVGKSSQFPAFLKERRPPKRRFGQDGDFFLSELISQVAAHKLPRQGAGQALQSASGRCVPCGRLHHPIVPLIYFSLCKWSAAFSFR